MDVNDLVQKIKSGQATETHLEQLKTELSDQSKSTAFKTDKDFVKALLIETTPTKKLLQLKILHNLLYFFSDTVSALESEQIVNLVLQIFESHIPSDHQSVCSRILVFCSHKSTLHNAVIFSTLIKNISKLPKIAQKSVKVDLLRTTYACLES